jgi:hypothetical protein
LSGYAQKQSFRWKTDAGNAGWILISDAFQSMSGIRIEQSSNKPVPRKTISLKYRKFLRGTYDRYRVTNSQILAANAISLSFNDGNGLQV